jgi:hypothetical protein
MSAGASSQTWGRTLRWRINRLRCMSAAELPYRAARLIAAHVESIAPRRRPIPPIDQGPWSSRWVHVPEGLDPAPYVSAADRIAAGALTVFEVTCADGGSPPRWNCDPKTGVEAPLTAGKLLDYRDRRLVGDIKYLWEVNRHLHLVTLAQGYALTREARYLRVLQEHLESWIRACPYGRGPNWCSALEAGIRLINWSIAWQLAGGAAAPLFAGSDGAQFRRLWLNSVYEHARFIHGYFSRHSSANNHLIGEAAGLYIAGLTWPCWPRVRSWRQAARQILEREALLQSSADGVNLEQAVCYQQFVLDFLLLALLAGRSAGERFSAVYEQRLEAQLAFLASIMDTGGNVPMIGDSDDGAVTQLARDEDFSAYRSLLASGAILFGSGELKAKAAKLDDKTRWLFGSRAEELFRRVDEPRARADGPAARVEEPRTTAAIRRAFPGGGYYVLGCDFERREEIRLVADAGPLGYRSIAAHGHADALAFTLSLGGLEFLIDPGTYAYHGGGAWRRYFRGTAAHNTLRIDGVDQSQPGGDFMWMKQARAQCEVWESSDAADVFEGWHDGYLRLSDPVLHRRRITLDKRARRVVIEDRLEMSGVHEVELFLHCDERCTVEAVAGGFAIRRGPATLVAELPRHREAVTQLYRGSLEPLCGWVSRRYDERHPSPTLVWRARLEGDALLRTELICRSDYPPQS